MTQLQNRSLDRGITLMEILARTGANTLAELHAESGLPKSTIRRLLATLQARRLVRRSLSDRKYRINITLPVSAGAPIPKHLAIYVDVAVPLLSELTAEIEWPSDVHILERPHIRVIDSTRPLSPFHLYRGIVNQTLNVFGTATGQVCLANMSEALVREYIAETNGDLQFGLERFRWSEAELFNQLEMTRRRGYGVRSPKYLGVTVIDDGLSAIAVAILKHGETFGAITILYPRGLMAHEEMADRYFDKLKATAGRISKDLESFT
jgi:IclR family mhp operon transcriptional activator